MADMLTEVKFWLIAMSESERTIICSPELESRCKMWVDARGMGGIIKIQASRACPDDKVLVLDENAADAAFAETMDRRIILGDLST